MCVNSNRMGSKQHNRIVIRYQPWGKLFFYSALVTNNSNPNKFSCDLHSQRSFSVKTKNKKYSNCNSFYAYTVYISLSYPLYHCLSFHHILFLGQSVMLFFLLPAIFVRIFSIQQRRKQTKEQILDGSKTFVLLSCLKRLFRPTVTLNVKIWNMATLKVLIHSKNYEHNARAARRLIPCFRACSVRGFIWVDPGTGK